MPPGYPHIWLNLAEDPNFSDDLALALRKAGYDVVSVHETEWVGFKNGALGAEIFSSQCRACSCCFDSTIKIFGFEIQMG